MQVRYRSDHSNQVHQLVITVSKHMYLTQDGRVLWQQKPFDISLKNYNKTGKTHVINYIIRDHFSGVFYGAVAHTDCILPAMQFLMQAWSPKSDYPFEGLPDALVVSRSYIAAFPELTDFVENQSVKMIPATSGFQAGVRDVRTWENHFFMSIAMAETIKGRPMTFDDALAECDQACRFACDSKIGGESKLPYYIANRPTCRFPKI